MKSDKRKTLKKVWGVIIITIIIYIVVSFAITKIVYDACFVRYDKEAVLTPELQEMVAARKSITFESSKNTLAGYFYGNDESKGLVVIAGGHNSIADDYLWQIKSFLDYGWQVFAFDGTGCGDSEGNSCVGFSQEVFDLRAALQYVNSNYEYEELYIFGHSRGGYAACTVDADKYNVAAIVSVSGLNSAMEAVMEPAVQRTGFLAYGNYHFLWMYQSILFGADVVNLSAEEELDKSGVPALIIQGSQDEIAPPDSGSIYSHREDITSDNVEYYICDVPGQNGHTDLMYDNDGTANDVLMNIINQFYSKKTTVSN